MKYQKCYELELLSRIVDEITALATLYSEENIMAEILDEKAFLFSEGEIYKRKEIGLNNLKALFRTQNVTLRSENEIDLKLNPVLEDELFHWETYVNVSRIHSTKNSFSLLHIYSLDLVFVSTTSREDFSIFNELYEYKQEVFYRKLKGDGTKNYEKRMKFINSFIDEDELDSYLI